MSEAKFTKGPWVNSPLGPWIIETKDEIEIADISASSLVNATANAHLIAAAPELYEALEDVLYLFGQGDNPDEPKEVSVARAALAKARGETP